MYSGNYSFPNGIKPSYIRLLGVAGNKLMRFLLQMMPGNLIWCFLFMLPVKAQEQSLQRAMIPVIDGSYSNKQMLLTAGLSNPSSLIKVKTLAASVEMESTYLLKEARLFAAMIVQPFGRSVTGMTVAHNGSPDFTLTIFRLFLTRDIGIVQVGGEFLFHHSSIKGYPSSSKVDAGISFRTELSPVFNAGFRLQNISGFFGKNENGYAPVIQAGAGYDISDAVLLGAEWLQEPGHEAGVTTGLLYRFHPLFLFMAGINWSPCQPYGGFQLNHHHWKLILKTSFHPVLGWSPSVGVSFGSVKNDQE